ncbi:17382_t:CDS:1, partial [Gigaspora margarita]
HTVLDKEKYTPIFKFEVFNTASTIAFRYHKAKIGTRMSSSNIRDEQKTLEDWLWGRKLGNRKLFTLSISLCEKLEPF